MKLKRYVSLYDEEKKELTEAEMYEAGDSGKCPPGGCIQKRGNKWRIYSAKDGHVWPQEYDTRENALSALKGYHYSQGK